MADPKIGASKSKVVTPQRSSNSNSSGKANPVKARSGSGSQPLKNGNSSAPPARPVDRTPSVSDLDKAKSADKGSRADSLSDALVAGFSSQPEPGKAAESHDPKQDVGKAPSSQNEQTEVSPEQQKAEDEQRKKSAERLVQGRTGLFGLDEAALGNDLKAMATTEHGIKAGNATLDAVNKTNRDDVSSQMISKMSSKELEALSKLPGGKEYLQRMIGHMNSGHVSKFEGQQIAKAGPLAFDKHGPLMNDKLSPAVTDAIKNSGSTHQKLSDGAGPVKFDEHSITIDKMPPGMTPEQFLKKFAQDPNATTDSTMFNLINRFSRRSDVGDPKPGDIYDIDIFGPDNGDVAIKKMEPNYFDVATLNTERHGRHPEFGTRRFGFDSNEDGSHTFYTRGASRTAENLWDNGFAVRMGGGVQNYDWSTMVSSWGRAIEKMGGKQRPDSLKTVLGPQ